MQEIAIIGAGPGGIAAARWLKAQGFFPRLFEAHDALGGQWAHDNPSSGIWPGMVTNTFADGTRFSDQPWPEGTALFPHNADVLAYMRRYAEAHGLLEHTQFGCRLTLIEQSDNGYALTFEQSGQERTEHFARVVIASGRFNKPVIPPIPGVDAFTGAHGVVHSFNYKNPDLYRDCDVVVAGGSISALEIASDLSMLGAASVRLTQRRQRYVNPKMVTGVPLEYFSFTYDRAVLCLDADNAALAASDESLVHEIAGDPSRYGAPKPHADFARAGVTGSQHYLNLVAEGRVKPVPWIMAIDGRRVTFEDGQCADVDGIIAATGFALNLPFLSDDMRQTLHVSDGNITLDEFTFHPDLPGLAFVGLWSQMGSYPVPLEQQARFLAYCWGGVIQRGQSDMRAGLKACRAEGHHQGYHRQNEMALRFARLCGTDPMGQVDDGLMRRVRQSATTGIIYRLAGPDALPDARAEFDAQFEHYRHTADAEV
ncbi:flavin-containing monooxygenase [Litoreibacter albidus]|uniref:flavin-containing monooxygenase n=1 Tax=Litoreibacter albidus TaxID=670155 RepID=UPI003735874E